MVVRLESQPVRAPEVDGELAVSVGVELVAVAGDAVHVSKGGRGTERGQTPLEELPIVRSPVPTALAVVRARLL